MRQKKQCKRFNISLVIMLLLFMTTNYAGEHVVCDVDVQSEQSAIVTLKWSENNPYNLRITSWGKKDHNTLVIYYDYGENIPKGWDTRTISGEGYQFPMRIMLSQQGNKTEPFSDMPIDDETKNSLLNLYYRNIISGYPDGTFQKDNQVTRTEFAKMITTTAKYPVADDAVSLFDDVSDDFWGTSYIMTLADKGILNGRPGGIFDPNGSITVGEVLAVINRTFSFYEDGDDYNQSMPEHWSNDDFKLLVNKGIVKASDDFYDPYAANKKATRETCVVLLSRVLEKVYEVK